MKKLLILPFTVLLTMYTPLFSQSVEQGKVSVTVNLVHEDALSRQLEEILRTKLSKETFPEQPSPLQLELTVTERQFYRDIDNLNSIYVHTQLIDAEGKSVMEESFFSETKSTILSSVRQNKEINKVIKGIKKYLSKNQKCPDRQNEVELS